MCCLERCELCFECASCFKIEKIIFLLIFLQFVADQYKQVNGFTLQ